MEALGERIDRLLAGPPYRTPPEERSRALLDILKDELANACARHPGLHNYVHAWPCDFQCAGRIADLPYLPAAMLKAQPPLSLVDPGAITRTLTSSSTTGQQPSRIALDSPTARRMTRGVVAVAQDFIGSGRRPYLVVDVPDSIRGQQELGARGAAIQGLHPFATEVTYCLNQGPNGELTLEQERLFEFVRTRSHSAVLVYGFTYILWKYLVTPLLAQGITLDLPEIHILHSGGWKRLQDEAVAKPAFNAAVAQVFGCAPDRVIDFYGLVEHVGIIYPDCPLGNKHVPAFGDVIIRDPLTLQPVAAGEQGIVQVCSVLPTSFPGHLLLTEDIASLVANDGCPCGRRGVAFRRIARVPMAELRGCGNIDNRRAP
jgi:Acyl-protein synthetase, LuxE